MNKPFTVPDFDDDLPDFTTPKWRAKFANASVKHGQPKVDVTKIATILHLDPDVLAAFRAGGPGWQNRINAALRKAAGLP